MIPAYQAVNRFWDFYLARDSIAYWLGAKGEILTYERMDELCRWNPEYFKRYDKDTLAKLKAWSYGKIGFDCSGLVCACFGISGLSSWTLREHMSRVTSVPECKAGSILWKKGHVALDLGYGICGQAYAEGHSIELGQNTCFGFELGGEYDGADYSMMPNW